MPGQFWIISDQTQWLIESFQRVVFVYWSCFSQLRTLIFSDLHWLQFSSFCSAVEVYSGFLFCTLWYHCWVSAVTCVTQHTFDHPPTAPNSRIMPSGFTGSSVKSEKITLMLPNWGLDLPFLQKACITKLRNRVWKAQAFRRHEGSKERNYRVAFWEMLDSVFLEFDSYWGLNILVSAASILTVLLKSVSREFLFWSAILNHLSIPLSHGLTY